MVTLAINVVTIEIIGKDTLLDFSFILGILEISKFGEDGCSKFPCNYQQYFVLYDNYVWYPLTLNLVGDFNYF